MDVCLVQNTMNTFSELENSMVIFDHSINIIAAALRCAIRTQGNKSNA